MTKTYIFTEAVNCGRITRIALESFHRHHDLKVHVFTTLMDLPDLGPIANHPNTLLEIIDVSVEEAYKRGHEGTAHIFALVLSNYVVGVPYDRVIHFDGDVFFKSESISLIENNFALGNDLMGSRRCFGNNPSGVPGLEKYRDTISTYFMGINLKKIPDTTFIGLLRMCQGVKSFMDIPILDFFDPVSHAMMNEDALVKYLNPAVVGGQDPTGLKNRIYDLNQHMDCGSNLVHFGGVGSGYAYFNKLSSPEKSYGEWAIGRWSLFAKLFYDEDIGYREPTVYLGDRWVNGNYDETIYQQCLTHIKI